MLPRARRFRAEQSRELREERGIPQETFALKCGIDRSHYGSMERGERTTNLSTTLKIATTLDGPASEVVARAEAIRGRRR
jgi:transcriptional regulator with XRE-family HTH domain